MVCHPWHGYPYQNNTTVIASSVIVSPFVEFAACKVTDKSQSAAVLTVVAAGLAAAIRLLSLSSNQAQISAMINKSLTGCPGCEVLSYRHDQT